MAAARQVVEVRSALRHRGQQRSLWAGEAKKAFWRDEIEGIIKGGM